MPVTKSKPKSKKSVTSRPKSTKTSSKPRKVHAKLSALSIAGDCYTSGLEWNKLIVFLIFALCLAVIWGSINYYNYTSAKAQYQALADY